MSTRTGRPDTDESPIVVGVAGHGLPIGGRDTCLRASNPCDDVTWRRVIDRVAGERLGGLLVAAIDDGALATTSHQYAEAVELHREAMRMSLLLEQYLLGVLDLLEAEDIECRVLKGAAHAHLMYPDPAMRSFGDIDLLVRGADLHRTVALFEQIDGKRRFPEPRKGFDGRFTKGVCIETAEGFEVDLHRTFAAGPFGLNVDVNALFDRPDHFTLGSRRAAALATEKRFLNACYHAVLGNSPARLSPLRDVAQALSNGDVDHVAARRLAEDWRGEAVLMRALIEVQAAFGVTRGPLGEWMSNHTVSPAERRALAPYIGPTRSSAAQAIAGLGAVSGPRAKLAYAGAMAFPARLRRQERTRRWRRGVRSVVARWRP